MALDYLGQLSVGACVPGASLAIAAAFTDLEARIAALAAFNPQPVSFVAQLALLGTMMAGISSMIALGIPEPSISLQIELTLALVAALQAQLEVIAGITGAFAEFGVYAYAYDGAASDFGSALSTELSAGFPGGGPGDHTNALVLATTSPACWAAMRVIFKVS